MAPQSRANTRPASSADADAYLAKAAEFLRAAQDASAWATTPQPPATPCTPASPQQTPSPQLDSDRSGAALTTRPPSTSSAPEPTGIRPPVTSDGSSHSRPEQSTTQPHPVIKFGNLIESVPPGLRKVRHLHLPTLLSPYPDCIDRSGEVLPSGAPD